MLWIVLVVAALHAISGRLWPLEAMGLRCIAARRGHTGRKALKVDKLGEASSSEMMIGEQLGRFFERLCARPLPEQILDMVDQLEAANGPARAELAIKDAG